MFNSYVVVLLQVVFSSSGVVHLKGEGASLELSPGKFKPGWDYGKNLQVGDKIRVSYHGMDQMLVEFWNGSDFEPIWGCFGDTGPTEPPEEKGQEEASGSEQSPPDPSAEGEEAASEEPEPGASDTTEGAESETEPDPHADGAASETDPEAGTDGYPASA